MVAWQSLLAAANGAAVVGSFGCEREREKRGEEGKREGRKKGLRGSLNT
jgi:hypothetical protein